MKPQVFVQAVIQWAEHESKIILVNPNYASDSPMHMPLAFAVIPGAGRTRRVFTMLNPASALDRRQSKPLLHNCPQTSLSMTVWLAVMARLNSMPLHQKEIEYLSTHADAPLPWADSQ